MPSEQEIIAIEQLAEVSLSAAIKLWNALRNNNPSLKSVEQFLTEADATADKVIQIADHEIAVAQGK